MSNITYREIETPLCTFIGGTTERGVCLCEYGSDDAVLFWLDDSPVATFGPDKIYSRRWDLSE